MVVLELAGKSSKVFIGDSLKTRTSGPCRQQISGKSILLDGLRSGETRPAFAGSFLERDAASFEI